ncbi:MAG TPA: bifunctional riboflavin kinase/FAD synthetase [Longimicrobiales bacterium]
MIDENDSDDLRGATRRPGAVVTVGTFDGVHRGHLAVIDEVRRQARIRNARSVVVTFEPHPLRVVRPEEAPLLLTTPEERHALLAATGVDEIGTLRFTREMASFSPRRFVEEILIARFGMTHLVMGYDHGLGRGRSGDVDALRRIGDELGFGVDVVPALTIDDAPISSTRVREALARGDVAFAARGLGRPYSLHGDVVRGAGRGRELGFPTANLDVADPQKLLPLEGIYAVQARGADGRARDGVLHLGPRPTFEDAPPSIELHLFDFEGDLYGRRIEVAFCGRIREIRAFPDVESLIAAMHEDCARARGLFEAGGGACQGSGAVLM